MESTTTNAFRGHCALQLVDAVNNVKHALEDSKKKKKKSFYQKCDPSAPAFSFICD